MRAKEFITGDLSPFSIPAPRPKFLRAKGPNGKVLPGAQMNSVNPQDGHSAEAEAILRLNAKIRDKVSKGPLY